MGRGGRSLLDSSRPIRQSNHLFKALCHLGNAARPHMRCPSARRQIKHLGSVAVPAATSSRLPPQRLLMKTAKTLLLPSSCTDDSLCLTRDRLTALQQPTSLPPSPSLITYRLPVMSDLISLAVLPIVPPSGLKRGCNSEGSVGLMRERRMGQKGFPVITSRMNNV